MPYPILVIGAGAAGIAAAVEISSHTPVILAEARPYIGGRARSFVDRDTGEVIDNGQHVFMGCYSAFLSVIERLGTGNLLRKQKALRVAFADADGTPDMLDCSILPGAAGVVAGIMRLSRLKITAKAAAILFAAALRMGLLNPKGLTVRQFLRKYYQPEDVIRRLWEPIVLATLNATIDDAAAELLVEVLRRAFFGAKDASQIIISTAGLTDLFAPCANYLRNRGGQLLTGATVEELTIENGNITAVRLATGETIPCRAVIAAIPPKALERLLPNEWRSRPPFDALAGYEFSPIVSLYLWFDRPVMSGDFTAMLGTVSQWVFNRRALCDAPPDVTAQFPGHIAITVSAGSELVAQSPEALALHCAAEFQRAFPEAAGATLLAWKVIKEKAATFLPLPAIVARRHHAETPCSNLFLAGDWTATGLPATLEGAAQSGIHAARLALEL